METAIQQACLGPDAVRQALHEAEHAIESHPEEVVAVYRQGISAYFDGWARAQNAGPDDQGRLAARYSLAMSFISAWYHLHSDKANRDKAAHAGARVVTILGHDAELAFMMILKYEQAWRRSLRAAGVGNVSSPGALLALGVKVLVAAFIAMGIFVAARAA